eukprot:TRINITY_DN1605_c0_g1_i3.p1 TRINITY_DN1605_c0_g1~~TRINITY_DN1605_c0_g1_i3.p1  ORF type:complete len:100 (+),score=7.82 TRINITY_DN1605_c0_g1_i3:135-434(+)
MDSLPVCFRFCESIREAPDRDERPQERPPILPSEAEPSEHRRAGIRKQRTRRSAEQRVSLPVVDNRDRLANAIQKVMSRDPALCNFYAGVHNHTCAKAA